jgi:acyl carrier protein
MTETEAYDSLTNLFREIFADDEITLGAGTSANDIEGWDSIMHIKLIVAVETRLGLRFRTSEIDTLHNIGDFVRLIMAKT